MQGNISKFRSTEESTESMILQWIGFFVPKKPIHCKLIDLTHFFIDLFLLNFVNFSWFNPKKKVGFGAKFWDGP